MVCSSLLAAQLRFLNNKGYLGVAKVPPKAAGFSAAGGTDEDGWMDGDTDATGAGELFACHSLFFSSPHWHPLLRRAGSRFCQKCHLASVQI